MSELICPYCDHGFDDDGDQDYQQDALEEFECPKCEKIFMASISYMIHYSEFKTPCKNGEPCDWGTMVRYPLLRFGKTVGVECRSCHDKKEIRWQEGHNFGYSASELENLAKEYL